MVPAALILGSYLLGSICFGLVYARARGVDLREIGSGNVGATNVGRALGKRAGRVVLALDLSKGLLAMRLGAYLEVAPEVVVATGLAAVLGHVFPVWFRFRGGKGAATALGVLLGGMPLAGVAACGTFVILKGATRRASVGSLGAVLVGALTTFGLYGPSAELVLAIGLLVVVTLCHAENIRRLSRGEEPPS